jgi:hypothetical protein
MWRKHSSLFEVLDRSVAFLVEKGSALDSIVTPGARSRLVGCRDRLAEYLADENARIRASRAATARKMAIRNTLVLRHIRPISLIASAQLRTAEEFKALVARGAATLTDIGLVQIGFGIARAAKRHEADFVEAGLAPDFIARLAEATEAFKAAIAARGEAVSLRRKAAAGIDVEWRAGKTTLALIDVMMRSGLERGDPMRAEWRSLSRARAHSVSSPSPVADARPTDSAREPATESAAGRTQPSDSPADVSGPPGGDEGARLSVERQAARADGIRPSDGVGRNVRSAS